MISDYDKQNIDKILAGDGEWFAAHLLRYVGALAHEDRTAWKVGFPIEVEVIGGRSTSGRACSLSYLMMRADSNNAARINQCLEAQLITLAKRIGAMQ